MIACKRIAVLILVAVAAVSVTSCGGGDEKKKPAGKKPARASSSNGSSMSAGMGDSGLGPTGGKVDIAKAGKVIGRVKLASAAPKAARLDLSKDPWCSKGHEVLDESIVASADGGLADVVAYLDGLDGFAGSFPDPQGEARLVQEGCKYVPHVLCDRAGQEVAVVNADDTSHNYHFTGRANDEINRTQPKPTTDYVTFDNAEVGARMQCDIHGWMLCHVHVFDHPCFAVSKKDGSFEISGVPPGRYELRLIHANCKASRDSIPVTVSPSGSADIGEVTFTLP